VNVWSIYPANVNSDQIGAGVKAGVLAINNAGGIGGHVVVVKECKTDLTPQGEIQCMQQAADDADAIAVISPLIIITGDDSAAILDKAGLPAINSNPDTPGALVSAMQYPLGQNLYDQPACATLAAKAAGAKSIAFGAVEVPNALDTANAAAALAEGNGATTKLITLPMTTTDVAPYVQQAVDTKADLIIPSVPPQLMGAWITAQANSGSTAAICAADGLVPFQVMAGLGAAAPDIYLTGSFPEVTWDYPLLTQFKTEAAAEVAAGDAMADPAPENNPNLVLRGWMGAYALAQVAKNIEGDVVTRETLVAALNKTTVTFGEDGKAPLNPIDFSKPNSNPAHARVFNTGVILKKWNPDTMTVEPVGDGLQIDGSSL